jgi:hypothetical protein
MQAPAQRQIQSETQQVTPTERADGNDGDGDVEATSTGKRRREDTQTDRTVRGFSTSSKYSTFRRSIALHTAEQDSGQDIRVLDVGTAQKVDDDDSG